MKELAQRIATTLGLDERESQVYVELLVHGAETTREIGLALGIGRNDAYRACERLVRLGLLALTIEKPERYTAVDPDRVFDAARAETEARRTSIEQTRHHVLTWMETHRTSSIKPPVPGGIQRLVHGRVKCRTEFASLVRDARDYVLVIATLPYVVGSTVEDHHALLAHVKDRIEAGLTFKVITSGERQGSQWASILTKGGVEVRYAETRHPICAIVADGTKALVWQAIDAHEHAQAPDDVALYSSVRGVVQNTEILFESLWEKAGGTTESASGAKPPEHGAGTA